MKINDVQFKEVFKFMNKDFVPGACSTGIGREFRLFTSVTVGAWRNSGVLF